MRKSPFVPIDEREADHGPVVEPSARWVRVRFGGQVLADSRHALLLRQYGREQLPSYYFPQRHVRMDALVAGTHAGAGDEVSWRSVRVGDHVAHDAAWIVVRPPSGLSLLSEHVSFAWGRMDGWYEEEEQVFVHARDPYKRVDVLPSSRHVQVVVDGVVVAESRRPHLLFETTLPTRYYIPSEDVRMELLEPTGFKTRCPYKGIASYWNLKGQQPGGQNIVWSYPDPIAECPRIRGLLCFFNERVDLIVDGELQVRPTTPWS